MHKTASDSGVSALVFWQMMKNLFITITLKFILTQMGWINLFKNYLYLIQKCAKKNS